MLVITRLLGKASREGTLGPRAGERGWPPADAGAVPADQVATGATCWGLSLIYQQGQ